MTHEPTERLTYDVPVNYHEIDVQTGDVRVSGLGCCFCGEGIEPTQMDPVTIDLTANDEKVSQLLWAHARCLDNRPNVRISGTSSLKRTDGWA